MPSMDIDEDEVEDRSKMIEDKINEQMTTNLENKVNKVQQTALKAITRELNLEDRLKREEMMKAKAETKVLLTKFHFEKAKKEKLEEAIDDKENEDTQLKQQRQTTKLANNIVSETDKMINKKRLALKKKIMEIRKTTERRKRLIENKINLLRGKMTKEIAQASKKGSIDNCKTNRGNQDAINAYCDENIISDFNRNKDCKNLENFCYICCETEFGTIKYDDRAQCYDMCDNKDKAAQALEQPRGDWIWKINTPQD